MSKFLKKGSRKGRGYIDPTPCFIQPIPVYRCGYSAQILIIFMICPLS